MNVMVDGSALSRYGDTPHVVLGSTGSVVQPSSGYAAMIACEWPGISISGIDRHESFRRVRHDSRTSSCV